MSKSTLDETFLKASELIPLMATSITYDSIESCDNLKNPDITSIWNTIWSHESSIEEEDGSKSSTLYVLKITATCNQEVIISRIL